MAPVLPPLATSLIDDVVNRAVAEDIGLAGDITTNACIPATTQMKAAIAARKPGVIAGVELARAAFKSANTDIDVTVERSDGERVTAGDNIISLSGPARGILIAERVALNFLGRLSGIATATAALVDAVAGTDAKVVCTRKTTPTLRAFEKFAVRCGGGHNHRFGLYDAVMIKDNHIAAAGGIAKALKATKAALGHMVKIEIEVDDLKGLEQALTEGADVILLDNMGLEDLRRAVQMNESAARSAILEASGNVTIETVGAIAKTGVHVISSGWITHSAPNLDLGLDALS